jgi:hypothetical protein
VLLGEDSRSFRRSNLIVAWNLGSLLLRRGLGAMTSSRDLCRGCGRTPLSGERMYVLASGRRVCALCRAALPEDVRDDAEARLVPARERAVPPAALSERSLPL